LTVLDLLAGIGLLVAAAALRRSPKLGGLMLAAGLLWFLGNLVTPLVFAHRGPLTGAMLIYPATSRLPRSRLSAATIVISCVLSTIYPLGRLAVVTITVWVLVLLCAWFDRPRGSAGHRSQRIGTWCAALLWGSLGVEALLRTWGAADDRALLAVYEIVVLAVCVALICDEWYRHWQPASLAELAVDLGERGPRSLWATRKSGSVWAAEICSSTNWALQSCWLLGGGAWSPHWPRASGASVRSSTMRPSVSIPGGWTTSSP
jgi:hypothetical protein